MRNLQRYPHVGAVHQHVSETRQWSGHWRTEPVIGVPTKGFGNLDGWGACPTTSQSVDPTIDAAVANAAGQESPEAVGEIADQMRSNGFDVPADAQTLRGQLFGVKAVD
jgi:hypothetical protein